LNKKIKKFFKIYKESLEDVIEIFKNLDEGEEVDIKEMENEKLK
jgi:phosphate uptake regulator